MFTCGLEPYRCVDLVGHKYQVLLNYFHIDLIARRGGMYVVEENGSRYRHPAKIQLLMATVFHECRTVLIAVQLSFRFLTYFLFGSAHVSCVQPTRLRCTTE